MLKSLNFDSPPYRILWQVCLSHFAIAWFFADKEVDIQLHDTYFVLAVWHVGIILGLLLACLGLVYWLLRNRPLTHWMCIAHSWVTSLGSSILLFAVLIQSVLAKDPQPVFNALTYIFILVPLLLFAVQILLPINVVRGFLS